MVAAPAYQLQAFPPQMQAAVKETVASQEIKSSGVSDEQILAHFGKRQQYRRNFGLVSIIGLGCTLSTLSSIFG